MTGDDRARDVAALRSAFDNSFAEPIGTRIQVAIQVLHVRVADRELTVRVSEISSIMRCPALVALPSDEPALRGLAAVRGSLVAVYDMLKLMGADVVAGPPRWIVCSAADPSVGLSFDELVSYELVDPRDVHVQEPDRPGNPAHEIARLERGPLELISIPLLLDSLRRRVKPAQTRNDNRWREV